jgi:hypothetical protein
MHTRIEIELHGVRDPQLYFDEIIETVERLYHDRLPAKVGYWQAYMIPDLQASAPMSGPTE